MVVMSIMQWPVACRRCCHCLVGWTRLTNPCCCLLVTPAGDEHYAVARGVQKVLQDYKNLQVRVCEGVYVCAALTVFGFMLCLRSGAVCYPA
jgi:hypothetical protein